MVFTFLINGIGSTAPPDWWTDRAVLIPDVPAKDYAAANLGQVKAIASKAVAEMNERLPGGAGPVLNGLVAAWNGPATTGGMRSDFTAVNQGQLKAIAKPFYDRLAELGYVGPPLAAGQSHPWTDSLSDDASFAAANLGQVKYLFSFDPSLVMPVDPDDLDGDGLPNAWEERYDFDPMVPDGDDDPAGDGLTNLQEFAVGRNPTKGAIAGTHEELVLWIYQPRG